MKPVVSIIVPVYNVASYLTECLDSILSQTYSSLEVILVNDGSTDNSVVLCQNYCIKDTRVKLLDKENGGVSSARNAGLDTATGSYVSFVDSDDVLAPDYVESMIKIALSEKADIVCGNILQWDPAKDVTVPFPGTGNAKIVRRMNADAAIEQMLRNRLISAGPYAKLIARDLLGGDRFSDLVIAEDLEFNVRIFKKADTILYCDRDIYHYRQADTGAMRKPFAPRHMDAVKATALILDEAMKGKRQYVKAAQYRLLRAAMYCAGGMIHSGQERKYSTLYKQCRSVIRRHAGAVMADRNAALRMRAIAALAAINIPLAWRVMTGWHKVNVLRIGRKGEG